MEPTSELWGAVMGSRAEQGREWGWSSELQERQGSLRLLWAGRRLPRDPRPGFVRLQASVLRITQGQQSPCLLL